MGGGSKGLMVVNGEEEAALTELIRSCNAQGQFLSRIDVRRNAPNSDHYPFTLKKVPAVFLYTQGDVTAYHHPDDRAEDLAWKHYTPTFQLLRDVVDRRMRIDPAAHSPTPSRP
jgi:Zn-dependent M28 family amino/carboxypeptidase